MTVKKLGMVVIAAVLLFAVLISPAMADSEDEEYDKMVDYLDEKNNSDTNQADDSQEEDTKDLKITPTLEDGQELFDKFSFSDESYDFLSLLNFLFYFLSCGGTLWVGILTVVDLLKGKTDAKSIYNDLKSRRSVQGIIITVLSVKIVYVLIDFLFNMEL